MFSTPIKRLRRRLTRWLGRATNAAFFPPGSVLGAIAGDIIGSVYENNPIKHANFSPLFDDQCRVTDDSVLTIATMEALLHPKTSSSGTRYYDYASHYREFGRRHANAGYGAAFHNWFKNDNAAPYNSWGNGSAMRASPIGWAFNDRNVVLDEAKESAIVTHDHPEGIKGAQATALAVYLARTGSTKEDIRDDIETTFGYDLTSRTIDGIRPTYKFEVSCQRSVPESIMCFLEGDSVESTARLAVSLGGDADTQACIACGIAEAYYGPLDSDLVNRMVRPRLAPDLVQVVDDFGREIARCKRDGQDFL